MLDNDFKNLPDELADEIFSGLHFSEEEQEPCYSDYWENCYNDPMYTVLC